MRATQRQLGALVAVSVGLGLFVAACGDHGGSAVADVGSGTPSPNVSSGGSGGSGDALAYAQCMRTHGIADFPDPDSSGVLNVRSIRAQGRGPAAPQFQAALKACKQYQPGIIHISSTAGGGGPSISQFGGGSDTGGSGQ
jgi:hypothetical protein